MARILRAVATLILGIMILTGAPYGTRVQGQACQGDISALTAQCGPYVQKGSPQTEPSQGCCGVVKQTDVQCVCDHLPPGADTFIDISKVLYVCKACGNPIKSGSKCGST